MDRKVLLFGATGKTGLHLIESLKSAKIDFALFVREQSVAKLEGHQYDIIPGDVLDPQAVYHAVLLHEFTDIVISIGSQAIKNAGIRAEGTMHIIDALQGNQKQAKIHVVSALGVGESASQLNWLSKLFVKFLLKSVMLDHEKQEKIVEESGQKFHIVRPVGLKDGPANGNVLLQNQGVLPKNTIQRADVAQYLVDSLLENKEGFSSICQGA
ncbi:MAG: NAD(P)-binding oxidoreductase [Bacteroidota bacterium]